MPSMRTRWAHDFEWSELEILAGYMLAIEFSAGAVLFKERDAGSFMVLLLDGGSVLKEAMTPGMQSQPFNLEHRLEKCQ